MILWIYVLQRMHHHTKKFEHECIVQGCTKFLFWIIIHILKFQPKNGVVRIRRNWDKNSLEFDHGAVRRLGRDIGSDEGHHEDNEVWNHCHTTLCMEMLGVLTKIEAKSITSRMDVLCLSISAGEVHDESVSHKCSRCSWIVDLLLGGRTFMVLQMPQGLDGLHGYDEQLQRPILAPPVSELE